MTSINRSESASAHFVTGTKMMNCKYWVKWIWLCMLTMTLVAYGDILEVRYPAVQHSYYAKRDTYYVTLLSMALERAGEPYELIGVKFPDYSEKRSVLLIQSDQYDVHWLNTTPEREKELLPVRVPLDKGAIGWRVFFVRPDRQPIFDKIQTADELKTQV